MTTPATPERVVSRATQERAVSRGTLAARVSILLATRATSEPPTIRAARA